MLGACVVLSVRARERGLRGASGGLLRNGPQSRMKFESSRVLSVALVVGSLADAPDEVLGLITS